MAVKYFKFDNLEIRTDKGKAIPELVHDFYPYPDNKDVVVKCSYLKNGESSKYLHINSNGDTSYGFEEIFRDKVLSIKGIYGVPKGKEEPIEIKTAEDFMMWPQATEMVKFLNTVAIHIMAGASLTEDEIKNFN